MNFQCPLSIDLLQTKQAVSTLMVPWVFGVEWEGRKSHKVIFLCKKVLSWLDASILGENQYFSTSVILLKKCHILGLGSLNIHTKFQVKVTSGFGEKWKTQLLGIKPVLNNIGIFAIQ